MIFRSKAPLRIGLAGGGTDISPYCDTYGGYVLNATINMYAYCTIVPTDDGRVVFEAIDRGERFEAEATECLEMDAVLPLHKGMFNRIVKDFAGGIPLSLHMTTYGDAPAGSGLGTSSAMVVAMLKCYAEWMNLPLGEYDMAQLAYSVEREDLLLLGGRQDQYASTFGGLNFIEFYENNRVVVNPLRIKNWIRNELENSIVLYYTGVSRDSATIIEAQKASVESNNGSLDGLHHLKKHALEMKEAVLKGDFQGFSDSLRWSWEAKKQTSSVISNPDIERTYEFIMANGGMSAKISGAGGGGFMIIYCDPVKRHLLVEALKTLDGNVILPSFTEKGSQAWKIYDQIRSVQ